MYSSSCIANEDDIVPKGTKIGSWREKKNLHFLHTQHIYTHVHTQYICVMKMS